MMDDRSAAGGAATNRILVLGATGRVGRHVVGELVRRLLAAADKEEAGAGASTIIYAATRDPSSGMYTCGKIER